MKIIGQLKAILGLDKTRFDRGLNSAEKRTSQFSAGIKRLAGFMAAAFSVTVIISWAKKVLQSYDTQAKAERSLLVALKGREDIQKNLIRQAQSLQRITLFGDEQTIQAAARLAMMLGTNEAAIKRLLPLVQDLATAKFEGNLVTAAELVAKSIGSSTNALSRYGITIEGTVGSADRLRSAIEGLNKQVGGQSAAAAEVGIGAFTQLKNIIGDLGEQIGKFLVDNKTYKGLTQWGRDFVEIAAQENVGFLKAIGQAWFKRNETIKKIHEENASTEELTGTTKVYIRTVADLREELQGYKEDIESMAVSDREGIQTLLKKIQETENYITTLTTLERKLIALESISGLRAPAVSAGFPAAPGIQPFGGTIATGAEINQRQIEAMTESLQEQQIAVGILSNAFDTLFTSTEDGFKAMVDSIISNLKRLVAELLARVAVLAILNALTGGGASFATIFKGATASMGLAKGASGGTVPSGYPHDTFPAMLSSGETVLTARQSRDFNRTINIIVSGDIAGRAIALVGRRTEEEN